jgi:hypothetical protein
LTVSGLGEERLEWPARGVLGFPVGVPQSEEVLWTPRVTRQEVPEPFPHLGTLERPAHRMDGDARSAGQQRHPLEGLSGSAASSQRDSSAAIRISLPLTSNVQGWEL